MGVGVAETLSWAGLMTQKRNLGGGVSRQPPCGEKSKENAVLPN